VPGADFVEWSAQNRVFTGIAALGGNTDSDIAGNGEPVRITCGRVTANFFEVSGVRPALGRGFLSAEDQPNGPGAIVLSHGLWQRRFGGDRGVLGKAMTVNVWDVR
jgi:putative ABC transport system permease protein